jgi:large subunit ribosomal protein L32
MRRNRRRAENMKITNVRAMALCPACGAPMVPHRACGNCGKYRGRQVIEVEEGAGDE